MHNPIAAAASAFCVALAVLVAIVGVSSTRRERRRQDHLQHWADHAGWTLTRHPAVDWGRRLPGGNKHGIDPSFSTVLHGRPVTVAEYSVTDASDGTTTNTHHWIVTATQL